MPDLIRECNDAFGDPPRKLSLWERATYFRVPPPAWLRREPSDKLTVLFRHLRVLFRDGTLVWGHVIQANQLMFQAGKQNCPGEVVYSLSDSDMARPNDLQDVARRLFELKGTEPADPELTPIAEYLTDEMIRVFGLKVPSTVSPTLQCRISTTFFVRKHLPNRRLCSPIMPIVVYPREPYVAMPLPARYWPKGFVDWWVGVDL